MGILFFVFGVICTRVFYELVIVLFKIHEKLGVIVGIKTKAAKAPAKPRAARKAAPKKA